MICKSVATHKYSLVVVDVCLCKVVVASEHLMHASGCIHRNVYRIMCAMKINKYLYRNTGL